MILWWYALYYLAWWINTLIPWYSLFLSQSTKPARIYFPTLIRLTRDLRLAMGVLVLKLFYFHMFVCWFGFVCVWCVCGTCVCVVRACVVRGCVVRVCDDDDQLLQKSLKFVLFYNWTRFNVSNLLRRGKFECKTLHYVSLS